jgi:hypothetical protein
MGETYLWHVWPARHWPSSAPEETAFLAALEQAATGLDPAQVLPFERGDLTTVLNALRNGMHLDELVAVAPGVRPDRLLSAYRHIDTLRRRSVTSFVALCDRVDEHTTLEHGPHAALLMPVPTYRLIASLHDEPGDRRDTERGGIRAAVDAVVHEARRHEQDLCSGRVDGDDAVRLGRVLYDPFGGGIWSNPYYLPDRVGALVPARVRDLLGERPE